MNRAVRLVPAILTDRPETLETLVRQAETFTDFVQIDITDGKFVPSKTITWQDIACITTRLSWEAHLMVERPENYLRGFKQAGARKAVFHYETTATPEEVITLARKLGLEVGLAINPETPVSSTLALLDQVDSVLLLSVNPGFYGSKFIPEVLNKVAELRAARPEIEVGIDGGIKESNIPQVAQSGVDVIYAGSAIFLQPEPGESFRHLLSLIDKVVA